MDFEIRNVELFVWSWKQNAKYRKKFFLKNFYLLLQQENNNDASTEYFVISFRFVSFRSVLVFVFSRIFFNVI